MPQHYPWYPAKKADQIVWLQNCTAAWVTAGPALGFTAGQVTEFSLLLLEILSVMNDVDQCQIALKAINEWRDEVIYGPETNIKAPDAPSVATPTAPTIFGGFFAQLKRWRAKSLASATYTESLGEALGFIGAEKNSLNPNLAEPDFRVSTAMDYWVNFNGSLQGFDAVKVEYQRKGSVNWENVGFLTKAPGGLQITPTTPGTAEMGMVRCVFVLKNDDIGSYSPNYPVTVS